MSNNYTRHLEFELAEKVTEARAAKRVAEACEATWKMTIDARKKHQQALERIIVVERDAAEVFRSAHRKYINVRQEVGELQDELFNWDEDVA